MKLHFEEPVDQTKKNSAIFEFFTHKEGETVHQKKIKGKSLARLIEERKISSYYNKKKDLRGRLKLLQTLVVIMSIICVVMIAYVLIKFI